MSIYDKRRRIIQNQTLILFLVILTNYLTFPIIPGIILLLYQHIPYFAVYILIIWVNLACFTLSIDLHYLYQKWETQKGYGNETDYNQKTGRKEEKHAVDIPPY